MQRRFGVGAAVLAAMLWAGIGLAQTTMNSGGGNDIVDLSIHVRKAGGSRPIEYIIIVPSGPPRERGTLFEVGPGTWIISAECHGGGECALPALTGLSLNGRPVAVPGPTREFELRLGDAGGVRRVTVSVEPTDPARATPRPTRRVVISDGVSGDERDAMLGTVRRVPRADPAGDNARGDDGGGAGGGGAGSP